MNNIKKENKKCCESKITKEDNLKKQELDHGGSTVKPWKLIIGLPLLFFAIWITIGHFGAMDLIPNWLMNPWTSFSLATFSLILYGGDYFKPVWNSLKQRKLSISLFLALSIATAYIYSLVIMITYYDDHMKAFEMSMFEAVIEITYIVFIGYYIDSAVEKKANKDINSILDLSVKEAIVIRNGKQVVIDSKELKIGDIVLVKNGAKFPTDGIIISGNTTVDESAFTGEPIPINKTIGNNVFGGSLSQGEAITMEVTSIYEDSILAKIISNIYDARNEKSEPAKLATKLSKYVLPFILISALSALMVWGFMDSWTRGVEVFVTTIIVACPMSFLLLSPTSTLISSAISAKKGIMFNRPNIFEKYKNIDTIMFDKTGTLTEGKLSVIKSTIPKEYNKLVSSMEKVSSHPIAKSIVSFFNEELQEELNPKENPGFGVEVEFRGTKYYFGSSTYIKKNITNYKDSQLIIDSKKTGSTFSYLSNGNEVLGYVELKDTIKKSAKSAIDKLLKKNINLYIVSGDNEHSVKYVAKELNIPEENVLFDQTPESKRDFVKKIQNLNQNVLFMGDGINDSIALETSNVGVSVSSGSDLAIDSSDVTLVKPDLNLLIEALEISKGTIDVIKYGNVAASIWILGIVSVSSFGLLIPAFGAVAMVLNDTLPIFVSMTLFRFKRKKQ